jgi:hypothetical protein
MEDLLDEIAAFPASSSSVSMGVDCVEAHSRGQLSQLRFLGCPARTQAIMVCSSSPSTYYAQGQSVFLDV